MSKKILVLDSESTCWLDKAYQKSVVPEIIQIGLVVVDAPTLSIERQVSYLIKNQRHEISEFCTSLTGITQQKINKHGFELEKVCHMLASKWGVGRLDRPIVAWGDEAAGMITDFGLKGVSCPFHGNMINLAQYYRFNKSDGDRNYSQKSVCELYNIPVEEPQHDAEMDAVTLSNLLIAMIKRKEIWPTYC